MKLKYATKPLPSLVQTAIPTLHFRTVSRLAGCRAIQMSVLFLFALLTDQNLIADTPKCNSLEIEGRQLIRTKKIRSCTQDSDCTMYTQCPLGCYRPINRNSVQHLEKFLSSYRMSCGRCMYECVAKAYDEDKAPPEVKCISNLCEWTDEID